MIDPIEIAKFLVAETDILFGLPLISQITPENVSKSRYGSVYFSLPVRQEHGIFSLVISQSYLQVSVTEQKATLKDFDGIDRENDDPIDIFCVHLGLHYQHPSGGSNGSNILTVWFDHDGKWLAYRKESEKNESKYNEHYERKN